MSLESDLLSTQRARHKDCFSLYTYNVRILCTGADLQVFLEAANDIKFHVIGVQEAITGCATYVNWTTGCS
ncbi:hypothetical protein KIN20_037391 [Parelaphostrongylus tenuis]|uniref:Uncharacterized protein n=1 Tax=Parelaphostrongylus tenuis TaxID=148309 RepID=A0AAD5RE70_PARTN|nr:hypothetical protein KIN20_037391 [Parelaphostrongylus tenuis]